jgi:streptomycin 6-kinase
VRADPDIAPVKIPERLLGLAGFPGGAAWLGRLPSLVDECVQAWSLRLGEPFPYANVSVAVPVTLPDGSEAVLKVGFPHWESEHEAAALAHWDGDGAVRLLAHDRERNAMLLERCVPGTCLLDEPDEDGFRIAAGVLRALHRRPATPGHPFTPIAVTAARWAAELPRWWVQAGRPFERGLLDAGVAALTDLPPTQGELVVCHQDFHRGNVLAASRRPWLAIDPKPVVAEREFDTAALLRDGEGDVGRRLDLLASELRLDRERMRRWGIAKALAWGFAEHEPRVYPRQIECARRLWRAWH